jgi:putative lipoic acid-binding regulatory protein
MMINPVDETQDTLFEFPCEFPIKIMGQASDEFEAEVIAIMRRHVPDLSEGAVKRRESAAKNYAALTVTVNATSKAQLDAIYRELSAHPLVLMAL